MAIRNVYKVNLDKVNYVDIIEVDFKWNPGFAVVQKQKNIKALHENYIKKYKNDKILEISSKSLNPLGIKLSAFNLKFTTLKKKQTYTVECAFQSSKKFENGGPYTDLLGVDSKKAKSDISLKESGNLVSFVFFKEEWPLEPKTLFYDWLYMNALYKNKDLAKEIVQYNAFTDIEFNPKKSINCQAYSAALFVSLSKRGLIDKAMENSTEYKKVILKECAMI